MNVLKSFVFALALVLAPLATGPSAFAAGPASVADLADSLIGAVVNISTSQNVKNSSAPPRAPRPKAPDGSPFQDFFDEFFKDQENGGTGRAPKSRKVQSLGSGFVIDPEGIIITNNHVIADSDEITVDFTDGTKLKAEVVGTDPKTDIAVLRVKPANPLKAVPFGNAKTSRVGDWVMAIGNPFGVGQTVTMGIISATGRNRVGLNTFEIFIQTDAAINEGNSGGALVNTRGELVGINTASFQQATELETYGISFAIPYALADKIMRRLIADGQVIRGYIGIDGRDINPAMARLMNADNINGILVLGVAPNSPAEKAGIITQDIITSIDGKSVINRQNVTDIVTELRPETEVDVDIIRKGKAKTIKVTIAEDPSN